MFDTLSERLRKTLGNLTGRGPDQRGRRRCRHARGPAGPARSRRQLQGRQGLRRAASASARSGTRSSHRCRPASRSCKIVNDELVQLLSAGDRTFHLSGNPAVVSLVGLQGSGKTTSTAKLARHVVKLGRRPLLVAADPYRPAAADQLQTLGKALDIPVYRAPAGTSVVDIVRGGVEAARRQTRDVVILDTAGRLSLDEELMAEITAVDAAVRPVETLLVVDAMTGQEAVGVAQAFVAAVPVTGLILTKIDGDARGGAALSISAVTGVPVKFLGTGEKTDALELFHPDRLAGRILGMGDILTLVERAQEHVDQKQAAKLEEKLRKATFSLDDMLDSMQQMQKMGPLGQVMSMIPGMGNLAGEAQAAVDRGDLQADRGDHPGDDRRRTPRPDDPQRLAATADRGRLGHQPARREPAGEAVRRDAEADEAALRRWQAIRRPRRIHGPAMSRRRGNR